MADKSVINMIKKYLNVLVKNGINARTAILFGSHAKGTAHPDSDIDILVISEEFDRNRWGKESELWKLTLKAGYGIQPIPVGKKQYLEDDGSTIIEVARREGIKISI